MLKAACKAPVGSKIQQYQVAVSLVQSYNERAIMAYLLLGKGFS